MSRYHWPTWADIVGREFDYYENWGNSGLGNRALIERLSELVLTKQPAKDDVVIVQWSEHHRFDLHMPNKFPEEPWFTGGSIFNSPLYNKEWASYYWNHSSYVMHTFNFIHLGKVLLESIPCQWHFLTMNDFKDDLTTHAEFDIFRPLFNSIDWLPPIKGFFDDAYRKKWFKKPIRNLLGKVTHYVDIEDPHPTPIAHYDYANKYIQPLCNINLDRDWAEKADALLDNITTHEDMRETFIKEMQWDNRSNWVKGL